MTDAAKIVRRRRVFYIPGYDPIHPRRYRELYRKEGSEQAAISGYDLAIRPAKPRPGGYGWAVTAQIDGTKVETRVEVLVWSDIVRGSMSNTLAATYGQMIRTAWEYIATGALRRLMLMRKGPVIAALYPVGALILMALVAVLAGHLLARGALWLTGASGALAWSIWAAVTLPVAYGVLRWFQARDNRTFVFYLMHDYAYSARYRGANPPELEARMADFRARIATALAEDVDEVLVVGHSSGAHLSSCVLTNDWAACGLPAAPLAGAMLVSGMYELEPVRRSKRSLYVKFTDELVQDLSAMRHLDLVHCPVIVCHGTQESPEFIRQAQDFAAALKSAGKQAELIVVQGANHFEMLESFHNPFSFIGRAAARLVAG